MAQPPKKKLKTKASPWMHKDLQAYEFASLMEEWPKKVPSSLWSPLSSSSPVQVVWDPAFERRLKALTGYYVKFGYYISQFRLCLTPSIAPRAPPSFRLISPPRLEVQLVKVKDPMDKTWYVQEKGWEFVSLPSGNANLDLSDINRRLDLRNVVCINFLLGTLPNRGRNDSVWVRDNQASTATTRVEHCINRGPQSPIYRAFVVSELNERHLLGLILSFV